LSMLCSAARKITMAEPNCQQRSRVMVKSALVGSPNQLTGSIPNHASTMFTSPSVAKM